MHVLMCGQFFDSAAFRKIERRLMNLLLVLSMSLLLNGQILLSLHFRNYSMIMKE